MIIDYRDRWDFFHDSTIARDFLEGYLPPDYAGKGFECPCPDCTNGSGSGKKGEGIVENVNPVHATANQGYYKCFTCGFYGDIADIVAQKEGIDDREQALMRALQLYGVQVKSVDPAAVFQGINVDDRNSVAPANNMARTQNVTRENSQGTTGVKRDISEVKREKPKELTNKEKLILRALKKQDRGSVEFIKKACSNIENPNAIDYYLNQRGISVETARYFNLGYLENVKINNTYFPGCIVFPTSLDSYCVRSTKDKVFRKAEGKADIPLGLMQVIKDKDKTLPHTGIPAPVFVVEGVFDAPSLKEASRHPDFDEDVDVIALVGTNNITPIVMAYKEFGIRRPLFLALDNDEKGRQFQEEDYRRLSEAGLPVYKVDLIPEGSPYKDANDFLLADSDGLRRAIKKAYQPLYREVQEYEKNLNSSKKERFLKEIEVNKTLPYIETGFPELDKLLGNGISPGSLVVLGGLSSVGKTTLTLQVATSMAASKQHDVLYVSLEMSDSELISKGVSMYTAKDLIESNDMLDWKAKTQLGVYDGRRYSEYADLEIHYINQAIDRYFEDTANMRIADGLGNIGVDDIRKMVEEHIRMRGKAPVIFLDYAQLLPPPKENGKTRNMTDKQIMDYNISELKRIARDYKTVVWAISAFNRQSYTEKVNMGSFRDSSSIEYSSDILLACSVVGIQAKAQDKIKAREEWEELFKRRKLELHVLKNRSGGRGVIRLDYHYLYNYYQELGNKKDVDDEDDNYKYWLNVSIGELNETKIPTLVNDPADLFLNKESEGDPADLFNKKEEQVSMGVEKDENGKILIDEDFTEI